MKPSEDPDPGYEGCKFLQWIKKRGNVRSFRECKLKTQEIGFDVKDFIQRMHPKYIGKFKAGDGERVIALVDIPWADRWMRYYNLEIPHHRHWKKLK